MRKYSIGIQNDQINVDTITLQHLIKDGWTIHSTFEKESFIKLNDGTLIRIFNNDLQHLKSELRNTLIEQIINQKE